MLWRPASPWFLMLVALLISCCHLAESRLRPAEERSSDLFRAIDRAIEHRRQISSGKTPEVFLAGKAEPVAQRLSTLAKKADPPAGLTPPVPADGLVHFFADSLVEPHPQSVELSEAKLNNANEGCYKMQSEADCIAAKDGRKQQFYSGSPCQWCCGDSCTKGGSNKCEPKAWLLSQSAYVGRGKNGLGEDTCQGAHKSVSKLKGTWTLTVSDATSFLSNEEKSAGEKAAVINSLADITGLDPSAITVSFDVSRMQPGSIVASYSVSGVKWKIERAKAALNAITSSEIMSKVNKHLYTLMAARKAQAEEQRKLAEEAERKKQEALRKAQEEAERERHEAQEAARKAHEAARQAKLEAERKAKEEAERKAKAEAERLLNKAKEEAEHKAKEAAERKAKEEAERKAKEEARKVEALHRAEAERQRQEAIWKAEQKAKEEARKSQVEALHRAEAERQRQEAIKKAEAEAERAREDAARKAKEEAARKAEIESAEQRKKKQEQEDRKAEAAEEERLKAKAHKTVENVIASAKASAARKEKEAEAKIASQAASYKWEAEAETRKREAATQDAERKAKEALSWAKQENERKSLEALKEKAEKQRQRDEMERKAKEKLARKVKEAEEKKKQEAAHAAKVLKTEKKGLNDFGAKKEDDRNSKIAAAAADKLREDAAVAAARIYKAMEKQKAEQKVQAEIMATAKAHQEYIAREKAKAAEEAMREMKKHEQERKKWHGWASYQRKGTESEKEQESSGGPMVATHSVSVGAAPPGLRPRRAEVSEQAAAVITSTVAAAIMTVSPEVITSAPDIAPRSAATSRSLPVVATVAVAILNYYF